MSASREMAGVGNGNGPRAPDAVRNLRAARVAHQGGSAPAQPADITGVRRTPQALTVKPCCRPSLLRVVCPGMPFASVPLKP